MRHAIRRTFLEPFLHWRRSAVFFGTLAGYFGFTLTTVASAYDIGGNGLAGLVSYFAPALLLPAFILWPLLYLGFRSVDSPAWRVFILVSQIAALIAFMFVPAEPIIQGFASGLLTAPFWVAYHISMVQNTTDGNRAFEVSLASFLGISGSIGGTVVCGFLLERGFHHGAIYVGFSAMFIGTLSVLVATRKKPNAKALTFITEAIKVVSDNPYLVRRIITQSLYDMPGFTLAALMHRLDFSAGMTAALLASRIIAEFFMAPVVGHFVHTRRNKGFGLGMAIVGLAWLFLLISPQNSISMIVFMITYGTGIRFAFNSLISGLYEMQSYASMMWTEVFLGVGRVAGMVALMPLLYYNTNLYMLELAVLAGLLVIINRVWMRKWRIV